MPNTAQTATEWAFLDKNGKSLIDFTSYESDSIKKDGESTDAPVEKGKFTNYNKVIHGYAGDITIARQGTTEEIQSTLEQVAKLQDSTELFSLVTPTQEIENMTLNSFDFSRTSSNGYGMLEIKLSLQQIEQSTPAYTSTKIAKSANSAKGKKAKKPIKSASAKNKSDTSAQGTKKAQTTGKKQSMLRAKVGKLF